MGNKIRSNVPRNKSISGLVKGELEGYWMYHSEKRDNQLMIIKKGKGTYDRKKRLVKYEEFTSDMDNLWQIVNLDELD